MAADGMLNTGHIARTGEFAVRSVAEWMVGFGQQAVEGKLSENLHSPHRGQVDTHVISTLPNRTHYEETPANARVLRMELAGLEPATSWVRSRRSPN
jgi:hypothetical protein